MGELDDLGFWKSVSGALALVALFAVMAALEREPQITAELVAEANDRKAFRPCDLTIAQFGPGERWSPQAKEPSCATAARDVPPHILSSPIKDEPQ